MRWRNKLPVEIQNVQEDNTNKKHFTPLSHSPHTVIRVATVVIIVTDARVSQPIPIITTDNDYSTNSTYAA